jgi:hypothetical protein
MTKSPYDNLINDANIKENEIGWKKLQVSGFPPESFYEEYNKYRNKKELEMINSNTGILNARQHFEEEMEKLQEELCNNLDMESDTSTNGDYNELSEEQWKDFGLGLTEYKEQDAEIKEPDSLDYYQKISQSEVNNIKYIYLPQYAFDRADVLHEILCGDRGFYTGGGCDSDRMLFIIKDQLEHCKKLLMNSDVNIAASGFIELFAVTRSSFMENWCKFFYYILH